ncbi:S9 family peptidase [Roseivirga pacifica]|uniref:S9 family peptidase n=1 Tax=Roseivirga pacifica TaxID=1267423 RepID=UPI0020959498|nr:S9 family peptidase [Roseivirga pacifica]MCO6357188.1 prolyl oligopeptidase family serine peptidase [Roseivirga pacifica]MCO6368098.1 prolyl oligopeptidase family serine peptidase [Roseivirga pacifica]MCO6369420.1 prolyl oligopeptidase family serine peptidase [Roseivirga pacifica]MCO6373274.1 prolyl oligopeptidase family serine peptidase [Roseivirga pacifica]MCO6377469.1 prolyl oligopeptidase family serine peptidase [Roseivirga pacifica]
MKQLLTLSFLAFLVFGLQAQQRPLTELTVQEIMQEPDEFIGTSPSRVSWSKDSKHIFFQWNPNVGPFSETYMVPASGGTPEQVEDSSEGWPSNYTFNSDRTKIAFERNGDIFIKNLKSDEETQITATNARESSVDFHTDNIVSFISDNNLFTINLETGLISQLTNFQVTSEEEEERRGNRGGSEGNKEQDNWLRKDQALTSSYIKDQRNRPRRTGGFSRFMDRMSEGRNPIELENVRRLSLSPDGKFVSYMVYIAPENPAKRTVVPDFVTQSGYTTDLNTRAKVGGEKGHIEMGIYSVEGDSAYTIDVAQLPGIKDLPDYVTDYPEKEFEATERQVSANDMIWSADGKYAVVHFASIDNKDRWIMRLLPDSGQLIEIDRQRDEAWIAGPGIGSEYSSGTFGFLPDNKTIYFQSEASGYSHLYTYDISKGVKKQLTKGDYEVYDPFLSKDGKTWYFTANMKHPGIRHFYSMPLKGGKPTQISQKDGWNEFELSPDEKLLAVRHSYIDQPYELFVQDNKAGAEMKQLTESLREGFQKYDWYKPEVTTFKAEDGEDVHARIYKPENPNGAAVIFVHGAGYLQNVHYGWSSYFREFMFNNLLREKGYTVLDIDYRASAGYGRDWRTGIYRYMGGKDLSDNIDGAKYLVKEHGIDPDRIGMYGGSYGGFITLFAMFKHPDVISAGAALRSVTDWAHYNHGYTSNILNTPIEDPIAYKRSSPIYFADGLEGDLLIAHGMVDTNVHFQDVVRLAQKLIELGKDNWEMAVYPVENHGFTTPSGWTDEYKRILKLFENTIGKQ